MSRTVVTVGPETPLPHAAELILKNDSEVSRSRMRKAGRDSHRIRCPAWIARPAWRTRVDRRMCPSTTAEEPYAHVRGSNDVDDLERRRPLARPAKRRRRRRGSLDQRQLSRLTSALLEEATGATANFA